MYVSISSQLRDAITSLVNIDPIFIGGNSIEEGRKEIVGASILLLGSKIRMLTG